MRPVAARIAVAYLGGSGDPRREEVIARLTEVLAVLRAQYMNYQHLHWQSHGRVYYADHLLFQRLYESVQDQVDGLAEKLIGYVGTDGLDAAKQATDIAGWVARWAVIVNPHEQGLLSEQDCQGTIQRAYDTLKEIGAMPLGLDDFLMSTSNAHDTNMYLLQQVLDA